jgi:hypothetical protein
MVMSDVHVHLRCLNAFVTEPQRDHGGIHPGVQEAHGRCVAKYMW